MLQYKSSLSDMYKKYSKLPGKSLSTRLNSELIVTEDQILFLNDFSSQPKRNYCRICNEDISNAAYDYEASQIPFIICPRCNHHNGAFYDDDQFNRNFFTSNDVDYAKHYIEDFHQRVQEIYMPKLDFLLETADQESINITGICDFGAGVGHFLKCCVERGIPSIGYELSSHMIEAAQKINPGVTIYDDLNKFLDYSFLHHRYNVISFIFSLEHVVNPSSTLAKVASHHPELIYVSVPHASCDLLTDALIPNYFSRQVAGAHTNIFTTQSLDYAMHQIGYVSVGKWYFGRNAFRFCSKLVEMARESRKYSTNGIDCLKSSLFDNIDALQNYFDKIEKSDEIHAVYRKHT